MAIAEGKPLPDAVAFAVRAGALACTKLSVATGLPSRQMVENRPTGLALGRPPSP